MALFDFGKFTSALTGFSRTLQDVRSKIELIDRQIEDVAFAPVAKSDIKAAMATWLDSRSDRWRNAFAEKMGAMANQPESLGGGDHAVFAEFMRRSSLPVISEHNGYFHPDGVQDMLAALLGKQMVEHVNRLVDELPWPEGGISASERIERLAKLNAQREKLLADERSLVAEAERVGLSADSVGLPK